MKFDTTALDLGDYRHNFLCLETYDNDKEKRAPLFYKFEDSVSNGILTLTSTTWNYMNDYKRLESRYTLYITIKLPSNVEDFTIYKLATRKSKHDGDIFINVPLWKAANEDDMDTTTG